MSKSTSLSFSSHFMTLIPYWNNNEGKVNPFQEKSFTAYEFLSLISRCKWKIINSKNIIIQKVEPRDKNIIKCISLHFINLIPYWNNNERKYNPFQGNSFTAYEQIH